MVIEWNLIIRLLIAGLLGGIIGFEREVRAKEAGLRTHFIVALGSALFMIISQYAFSGRFDAARVAAQVVSGIGFIGAGVIIFQKNAVRGVTTAAGLWVAAAIGLACGAGMYAVAIAAGILTLLCLEAMHFITRQYGEKTVTMTISPVHADELADILKEIEKNGTDVISFSISNETATIELHVRNKKYQATVTKLMAMAKGLKVEIS